jgi:hypothetical protein
MSEELDIASAMFPGFDPKKWEEPREDFPGEVIVSELIPIPEKFRKATAFRPDLPETYEKDGHTIPLSQWHYVVRRLDAEYLLLDGNTAPVDVHRSVDFQKWSRRENRIVPLSQINKRESFIINGFNSVFGSLEPPDRIVGQKANFTNYPEKSFDNSNYSAKNVLVPESMLPPDYQYPKELQVFKQTRVREENPDDAAAPVAEDLSDDEITALIVSAFNGKTKDASVDIMRGLPAGAQREPFATGLATGNIVDDLASRGLVTIDESGVISAA